MREEAERLPMGGRGDFVGAGEVLRGCRGERSCQWRILRNPEEPYGSQAVKQLGSKGAREAGSLAAGKPGRQASSQAVRQPGRTARSHAFRWPGGRIRAQRG